MKYILVLLLASAVLAGLWTGCIVDLDPGLEGVYFCEDDDDCSNRFECDLEQNVCVRPSTNTPDLNQNQDNQVEIESCDELDEDEYPVEGGLSHLREVCDGIDNNCDGEVDVIYCQSKSDCPSGANAQDPEGNAVNYQCNQDTGVCEAFPFNMLGDCAAPLHCIDGALQIVPEHCL